MDNEIKQITYNKKKINIFKIIKIIISIILILALIGLVLYFIFVYSTPNQKLKRHLIDCNYKCNSKICTKEIEEKVYEINYTKGTATIKSSEYTLELGTNSYRYKDKSLKGTCNYTSRFHSPIRRIDETYEMDPQCTSKVDLINELIESYEDILDEVKIDVNELSK